MHVSVVGAGHVGVPQAAYLATVDGVEISLVDVDQRIQHLQARDIGFWEPGLQQVFDRAIDIGSLRLSAQIPPADIYILCVGDKDARGDVSSAVVEDLLASAAILRNKVVWIRSTMPVGATRRLARITGAERIYYVPEFLRQGHALADLASHDALIIGSVYNGLDSTSYSFLNRADRRYIIASPETAEATKIARNAMSAVRVALINELAELFVDHDVDYEVVADRIIGSTAKQYGKPGLPPGGPCLPATMRYLQSLAENTGSTAPLVDAWPTSNATRSKSILERIVQTSPRRVLMVGLSYKTDTDDLTHSAAHGLVKSLANSGVEVGYFDPIVDGMLPYRRFQDLQSGIHWADLVVVGVRHSGLQVRLDDCNVPVVDLTFEGKAP